MVKRALLVGINYTSVPGATLHGCLNDVDNMKDTLINYYGYADSDIVVLRDDDPANLPTASNILNQLVALVANSARYEEIWFHYSGHGSQIRDTNGDEKSGYDSVIIPLDFMSVGVIPDDLLYNIMKQSKTKTYMLFDSCNSGSVCDLIWGYEYMTGNRYMRSQNNRATLANQNIYMISGSKDTQTSADAYYPKTGKFGGAFTTCFLTAVQKNGYTAPFISIYRDTCILLQQQGYSQKPILSATSTSPLQYLRRVTVKTKSLLLESAAAAAAAAPTTQKSMMATRGRGAAAAPVRKMKMVI